MSLSLDGTADWYVDGARRYLTQREFEWAFGYLLEGIDHWRSALVMDRQSEWDTAVRIFDGRWPDGMSPDEINAQMDLYVSDDAIRHRAIRLYESILAGLKVENTKFNRGLFGSGTF